MDDNILKKIEDVSKKYGIEFIKIISETDLKPW
jgi:hypothetical protein